MRWSARGRYVGGVLVLAGLYYGAAKLGYQLQFAGPVAAIVWLPAGVAIAFLSIGGLRFWPGVLVGDLLANDYSALPLGSALGQTLGNMLEVLVAVVLLRRLVPHGSPLDSVARVGRLFAAIAAGTAVSATIGSLSLWAGHVVSIEGLSEVWRTWWLGDASGALVVVPLALAWNETRSPSWAHGRGLEGAVMLVVVAGLSEVAFRGQQPWAYLVLPALAWSALRFDRRGATLAIAITVGFAVWSTTHYQGPFVFGSIKLSVLNAQLYIAVAALGTLCLAAVAAQREAFAEGLEASRARLLRASGDERRRLEHDLHDGAQQRLSALAVRLGLAADRALDARDPGAPFLAEAEAEVTGALDELREIAHGIHPAVLTDLGLAAAVRSLAVRSSVPVTVIELPSTRSDDVAEATAYFLFAEALTNSQKHARASSLRLGARTSSGVLHLEVVDDGIGGADERAGSGLSGLRDRVESIGGTFAINSPSGQGTRIAAEIPTAGVPRITPIG